MDIADPSLWKHAIEQLPSLTISLFAIVLILKHGMTFMIKRDAQFITSLREVGEECHRHETERHEAFVVELRYNRSAMQEFTTAHAKHETTMVRVAVALEKHSH